MSKVAPPDDSITFSPADLFGTWRVYVQRVESKLAGSTTQIGQTTFNASGAFTSGALVDAGAPPVTTTLTTGNLLVSANGSVTGSLAAGTLATADRYTLIGSMRAAKDVITGVLTANLSARTTTHYGLVTLVRDVTLFDLAQPAYSVTEGNTLTVTVKRTGNLTAPASVSWSVGGGTSSPADFVAPTGGTLTFAAGIATQTFSIKTTVNTLVDGNRSADIVLSAPAGPGAMLGSLASASLSIVDEDRAGTVKLSAAAYTVTESARTASIVIQRVDGKASNVVVEFVTIGGTALEGRDYSATNSSVTFSATDVSKTVLVPILENSLVDGARSFTFQLTGISPAGGVIGAPASATVTIGDNDQGGTVQFSAAAYTVTEPASGDTSAVITVARTLGTAGGVLVDFATADGTARAGHNYVATSGTLTFDSTNTSKTFTIPILGDALVEGDNTVLLSLGNVRSSTGFSGAGTPVLGAIKNAVLTIKDAQKGLQFGASNYSVSESSATATINVVRTGPLTDTATVRYSTSDGTAAMGVNYVPASGTLTFGPNISSQSFTVKILPDKVVSTPKTVLLLLSNANSSVAPLVGLGPRSSAVLTIGDTDAGGTIKLSASTYSVGEGAGSALVTVMRSGGAAGSVTVDYATCDASTSPAPVPACTGTADAEDYEPRTGTLTFGPGETTRTIQVPIRTDNTVEGNEAFEIRLSNAGGGATLGTPNRAVVTITDDDQGGAVQFSASFYTVNEPVSGNSSATITLTRSGAADAASVLFLTGVGTAVPSVNYVPVASTLVFDANEMSKAVPITILADGAATGNLTVPITLSSPGNGATLGTTKNAVLTIVDANRSVRFSAPSYTVNEGGTATITVLRGGSTTGTITVRYATADGSAVAGQDYVTKSSTLTFGAGVMSQTFTVTTLKRAGDTPDRSLTLTLDTPNPGTVGLPLATATLTITDVDRAGQFQFAPTTHTVAEGSPVALTVTRTGGSVGAFNVPWTVTGGASNVSGPTSGNVSFTAGLTTKTLALATAANSVVDGNRSVTIALGTPIGLGGAAGGSLGADVAATVNVVDNEAGGVIQFASAAYTVAENVAGGVLTIQVNRANPGPIGTTLADGILVDYTVTGDLGAVSAAPGFPLPTGTLTFGAGATAVPLKLGIGNDAAPQLDRNVAVTLGAPRANGFAGPSPNLPTLGAIAATSVRITDASARVQFGAATFNVVEGDPAQITITRTGSTTAAVTVQFSTADGTAVGGTNYTPTSGTITVSGASKTVPVPTLNDGVLGGPRTVLLSLAGASGASIGTPGTATLNILDRQSAGTLQFARATASVVETGTVRVTVTRTGSNLVGGVTVNWSATGGDAVPDTDFTPSSGTVTFEAGVTSQSFDITTLEDHDPKTTKTIVLSLDPPGGGAALGAPSAMTVFIVDRDQTVGFAGDAVVGEKVTPGTLQLVRSGVPHGSISVTATTVDGTAVAGQDYVTKSEVVTFQPGEIVKPFNVVILTQNASVRNGNRALSVVLSDPVNADLNAASTATLTILDSRPDLVIASVLAPSSTLTGKVVSTPSTVRNIGALPVTTPFSIGLYLVRAEDFDVDNPRAGSLVASQDVPGLAAGASLAFPTQVTIDDSFPAGDYYLSAVANFDERIAEADTTNNGRSSFPTAISVKRNLTKFKSASAAFSQTSPPAPPASAAAGPTRLDAPLTCDAEGSVILSGTFALGNQFGNSAQGQANLTGSLNDQPVQYVIAFTGTGDDNNNVTAVLDSVIFRSLTSPLTGTGTGSLVGVLDGRTLRATVTGQFTTNTGGACVFTGTLEAQAQTSFQFRLGTGRDMGDFGFGTSPSVSFPTGANGYGAEFGVFFDSDIPQPSSVLFTGPAGSGITSKPADEDDSHHDEDGIEARFRVGTDTPGGTPGGKWTVLYKGQARTFTRPPFTANASFVVVYPTATLDVDGNLTRIDWVYRDRITGNTLPAAPSFIGGVTISVDVNGSSGRQPETGLVSPSTTSFDIAAAGFSPPQWAKVRRVQIQYFDLAGNLYELIYSKAFSVQVEAQLANDYTSTKPNGDVQRRLNVFVDVPSGSVSTIDCQSQVAPYQVSIVNHDPAQGPFFGTPQCLQRNGSTTFEGESAPTDIFSAPFGPGFALTGPSVFGFQYDVTITPLATGVPFTVLTAVDNVEADPVADVITLTVPKKTASGFRLADAGITSATTSTPITVSWTLPTFEVRDVFVNPVFSTNRFGPGEFCSLPSNNLPDPTVTQKTFTFPTSCNGQPIYPNGQASVCVFIRGTNNEQTSACWFYQDGP
jgi:hypothetical protein